MTEQMAHQIAVVQMYIGVLKGVEVDISIRSQRDAVLLAQAAMIADAFFAREGAKIIPA